MSQNKIAEKTEHRQNPRYSIAEYENWRFKCNHKQMPSTWIVDLNQDGACIRVGKFRSYNVGDLIPVRIQHSDDIYVECLAEVKWKQNFTGALNMDQLGLEFVKTPYEQSAHTIDEITREHLNQLQNAETKTSEKQAIGRVNLTVDEFASAVSMPFFVGLMFALIF
jgi:PilZ domain